MSEDDILQEDTKDETLFRIRLDLAWECSCLTSIVQSVVEIQHSLHGVPLEQVATKATKGCAWQVNVQRHRSSAIG